MLQTIKQTKHDSSEEGFTLIELMIVVVIIGILAAIAIPIFANQQKAALNATVKSDVKNAVASMATESAKLGGNFPSKLPESIVTSDGVVLSLKKTGPLASNIDLSTPPASGQWSWAQFEQELSINTGEYSIYYANATSHRYLWYPPTGGDRQEFIDFVASVCAQNSKYTFSGNCAKGALANPNLPGGLWDDALVNGKVISMNVKDQANPYSSDPTSFGGWGYDLRNHLDAKYFYYKSDGTKVPYSNKFPIMPPLSAIDHTIWGSPTEPDPSKYCLEGYHESDPETIFSFDSNIGKVQEGKC